MNKKTFQIIFIFIALFTVYSVQALSNDQKWKILDNFKERQQELLFETNVWDFETDDFKIFDVSKRMNIYGNISEKIKYQRDTVEDKQVYELWKIMSLEESLDMLEADIEKSLKAVNKINWEVIEVKNDIEINQKTLNLIRHKITENRKTLLKYLEYIYKKSNNVYEDDKFDNLKSILLNDEDISGVINDIYYKNIIQVTWKNLINSHKKLVSELYLKKLELERNEKQLKQIRKISVIDSKILNDKRDFKERLLTVSKWKEALYNTFIKNKLDVEKKVKLQAFKEKIRFDKIQKDLLGKYNCEFVDFANVDEWDVQLTEKCSELNKVLYAEQRLQKSKSFSKNFFDWPVSPKLWISSFYKWDNYRSLFGSDHEAIDVVATQGTPLKAPADGYVFYLNEPKSWEYSFLALKHSDGHVTVYGHLSEINVQLFDYVRKGQLFAKTWGTYGTKWAGLMTTGPHLHFEVFQNEESIDPLNVLDLSYTNYSNLPTKYQLKFESDFRVRKWYEYAKAKKTWNVFRLDGFTEIERQKSLIAKYTAPSFRNWEMWVDESLNGSIDPTFTMCVGLAESGLWRNTKTLYNVWNIWNTDSGATRTFRSPREWVFAMIHTFNNRYLGKYTQIQQLSRYGNKEGTIYASSPDHWHNNIIKCMSTIKGYNVPDDYHFRLIQ
jgi:murein DD-endopeptidase MepM/ murein hydrolase activator NlpD